MCIRDSVGAAGPLAAARHEGPVLVPLDLAAAAAGGALALPLHPRARQNACLLYTSLTDKIQKLLRAAHGKAGDDDIAALVERRLQHGAQIADIIRFRAVAAVPVGGFHNKVIRVARVGRVLDERLMGVADVARENDDLRRCLLYTSRCV